MRPASAPSGSFPAATRHFGDSELLAYVSMRGTTGHGHHPRGDEALEPLARVLYARPGAEEMEVRGGGGSGGGGSEPAAEDSFLAASSAAEDEEEEEVGGARVHPLHPQMWVDNRYVFGTTTPLDLHTAIVVAIFALLIIGGIDSILGYIL